MYLGLTSTRFADAIGVQRSGISHILSGRNEPSYDFIVKLAKKYPQISLEWLILGQGPMIKTKEVLPPDTRLPFPTIIEEKKEKTNLKKPYVTGIPELEIQPNQRIVTHVNNIQQVILIYPDGTFKSLQPARED